MHNMMPNQARLIDARYQESHGQADRNQARNETAQQMSQALQKMSQALARFVRRCRRGRIIGGHAHMPRTLAGSARSARRKTRRHIVASCVFLDDSKHTRALAMRAYSEGQPRQPRACRRCPCRGRTCGRRLRTTSATRSSPRRVPQSKRGQRSVASLSRPPRAPCAAPSCAQAARLSRMCVRCSLACAAA